MKRLREQIDRLRERSERKGYACDCCNGELFDYPLHRVCARCEGKFLENNGRVCERCGRKTLAEGICLSCKKEMPSFDCGISPFVYFGAVASFINRVKSGNRRLACYFGERMANHFLQRYPDAKRKFGRDRYKVNEFPLGIGEEEAVWGEPTVLYIVPVPTTDRVRGERGYNQAEELAKAVAENLAGAGLTVAYCPDALEKKEGRQQKHLDFQNRMRSAEEAYRVKDRSLWNGRTVLVVDDIMTTGATGGACARRLKNAKAKEVIFLVCASLPEKR